MARINPQEVRKWFDIFHGEGDITEIRLLGKRKGYAQMSGYFTSVDEIIQSLQYAPDGYGIYSPINALHEACMSREQSHKIINADTTTSDNDIVGRRWILIDLDPKRPAGTNSTDKEKAYAFNTARRIATYLRDMGFSHPVYADSANGYHIYYRVNLANTPETRELIEQFLTVLNMFFGDDRVDVDTSVSNASRISKVIGTWSNKGTSTKERPQRESCFLKVPEEIKATDIAYIRKVVAEMPVQEKPSRANNYSEHFDLNGFILEHGIEVAKRQSFKGGEKIILAECPFDHNHKAPDSALFIMANGAIGFKCLHNSCSQYSWRDFRLHYDPNAYDRREYNEYRQKRSYYSREVSKEVDAPTPENQDKGKKWLQMSEIQYRDPSEMVSLPTGITVLDKKMMGLTLGDVSIISGIASSGKTSLIDFIILNVCQRGYKTAVWSGELQGFRFQSWLDTMAAGPNFVRAKEGYDNLYYAPKEVCKKIHPWLDNKLWLYNNAYGNKFTQLFADIKDAVDTQGVQLVVLDNLMAMNIDGYQGDKNERQTNFINDVKEFAKSKNIHVLLVCHPRKEQNFQLLRMESIAGTADLTNLADNVFIIHRVGRDFMKRAKDFFDQHTLDEYGSFDTVIEIAKNRSWGIKDCLIGMFFDRTSRRFKNDITEHIVYGWQDAEDDMPMAYDESLAQQGWIDDSAVEIPEAPALENDDFPDPVETFDNTESNEEKLPWE